MFPRLRRMETRQKLFRAQELFQRGEFAQAAGLFEEMAKQAEGSGMLDRAGDLHLQAARCHLQLNNLERADREGLHALRLFLRAGRLPKVRRMLPRMIAVLEQHGRHQEARELREKAAQLLGPLPATAGRRGTLPGKCPNCGGPIKPDEVNWAGPRSAECPYCGSVVNATEPGGGS